MKILVARATSLQREFCGLDVHYPSSKCKERTAPPHDKIRLCVVLTSTHYVSVLWAHMVCTLLRGRQEHLNQMLEMENWILYKPITLKPFLFCAESLAIFCSTLSRRKSIAGFSLHLPCQFYDGVNRAGMDVVTSDPSTTLTRTFVLNLHDTSKIGLRDVRQEAHAEHLVMHGSGKTNPQYIVG